MACLGVPLKVKTHPTHAKHTYVAVALLGGIALAGLAIALSFGRFDQNVELVNGAVLVSMFSGALAMIVFALRAKLSVCPDCRRLMTWSQTRDGADETRKFVCKRCHTVWDSTQKFETD